MSGAYGFGGGDERLRRKHWEELVAIPVDELDFSVKRTPEALERDGSGVTFSAEVMDGLYDQIKLWIGSRLMRHMSEGKTTTKMTVTVRVVMDDADVG